LVLLFKSTEQFEFKKKQRRRKNKREEENQLRQCFGFYSRKFIYTSVKTEKNEKKKTEYEIVVLCVQTNDETVQNQEEKTKQSVFVYEK